MSTVIDPKNYTFKFKSKAHHEHDRALTFVSLTMTTKNREKVATVSALNINRYALYDSFHQVMDEDDNELAEFSTTIFDKFGRIQSQLLDDEYHKGSGVWGRELNDGEIMFIFHVTVEEPYRRRGLGSVALQHFLGSEHIKEHVKAYCWPSPTSRQAREGTKENWTRQFGFIIDFFRKNKFRRVGCTQFFAYSPDPNHPSRNLLAAADVGDYTQRANYPSPEVKLTVDERLERYPVHALIAENKTPAVDKLLRDLHSVDPSCIHTKDDVGIFPISIAAGMSNLQAVKTLLSLGVTEDLFIRVPSTGQTPLESCRAKLDSDRQFMDTFGLWKGHDETDLLIEVNLKRAMGMPVNLTDEEYVQKMKYGCTCGSCAEGWLSLRMRFRLHSGAESAPDMMDMSLESFESGKPLREPPFFDTYYEYLPLSVRSELYKTFYSGYMTVYRIVAYMFKTGLPTVYAVNTELRRMGLSIGTVPVQYFDSRAIEFYIKKGGKVEYALDAVTDIARQQSDGAGDGTFDQMVEEDIPGHEPDEWCLSWRKLPRCANDGEFDLVRRMLGLDPRASWGPYELPESRAGAFPFFDFGGGEDSDDEDRDGEEMTDEEEDEDEDEDEMSE